MTWRMADEVVPLWSEAVATICVDALHHHGIGKGEIAAVVGIRRAVYLTVAGQLDTDVRLGPSR